MFKSAEYSDWVAFEIIDAALFRLDRSRKMNKSYSPRISLLQYEVTGDTLGEFPNVYKTNMSFEDKDELLLDLSSKAVTTGRDAVLKMWNDDVLVGKVTVVPEWEMWEDSAPINASANEYTDYEYMLKNGVPVHKFDLAVNVFDNMITAYERNETYADEIIIDSATYQIIDPTAPPPANLFDPG